MTQWLGPSLIDQRQTPRINTCFLATPSPCKLCPYTLTLRSYPSYTPVIVSGITLLSLSLRPLNFAALVGRQPPCSTPSSSSQNVRAALVFCGEVPPLITGSLPDYHNQRLAATLGSKSTLKRLTKKSVMSADISHLCDLIAEPAEPLALRLSSNLMVGVARVYKSASRHGNSFLSDESDCRRGTRDVCRRRHPSLHESQEGPPRNALGDYAR
jgi:N terminus of Rad21 / Rec8 like protein